jgi:hypothetical protein
MIFDSNSMPIFEDNSYGFTRRFTRVNHPFQFVDNPDPKDPLQKKKDPNLEARLCTEEELSGILNLVIERAKEIIPTREIHRRENDFAAYEIQSHSISDFIDQFVAFEPMDRDNELNQISSDLLYSKFEEYTRFAVGAKMTRKKFSRYIGGKNGRPSETVYIEKTYTRGFKGLRFNENEFKAFIEEKTKEYSNNPIVTIFERSLTKENDTISNSSGSIKTSKTIFEALLKCTGNNHKGYSEDDLGQNIDIIVLEEENDNKRTTDDPNEPKQDRFDSDPTIVSGKIEMETPTTQQSACARIMARIRQSGKPVSNFAVRDAMRSAGYDLTGKEIEALMQYINSNAYI